MKYYISDHSQESWTEFNEWWELIAHFYSGCDYFDRSDNFSTINNVAHNENDNYSYHIPKHFCNNETYKHQDKVTYYIRPYIIYDEYDRIINIAEIRASADVYNPNIKPKQKRPPLCYRRYFEYRKEPVPGTGKCRGSYHWREVSKNKSYVAKCMEYYDLFPGDRRIRGTSKYVDWWCDDFCRNIYKC